ncbi:MAG TPA: ABC transporter permease subunit [Gemmatales bacterium]|nr:ABC transporter permease subunit [Gemmatales bacterium]
MSATTLPMDRTIPLGALWTSYTLTLRGLLLWKRLLGLAFLTLIPLVVIGFFRALGAPSLAAQAPQHLAREFLRIEFYSVLLYFSSVVIPITTLLLASGMIRDEQENQTLTYLLLTPVPRWALYLSKLLAAMLVAFLLVTLGTGIVMLCLWVGSGVVTPQAWYSRWLAMVPCNALLILANAGIFALISVLLRPSLIIGVIYIAVFEVFLANFPFALRKFTSVHYYQCIVCNWIGDQYQYLDLLKKQSVMEWPWSLSLEIRPETQECVITLLSIFVVSTLLAMYFFTKKEYRLKTPEGS